MSRLLWAFDFAPPTDAQGREIVPDPEKLTQGFVCMPVEYRCLIKSRSEARAVLVVREWQEAEEDCLSAETKQWKTTHIVPGRAKRT